MGDIRFVEIEEALRIHNRQVDRFGGDDGIRDRGLLESALATPRASFGGAFVHEDVIAMAGAYLFHLCKNHPFVDGNKRVALAVMLYFNETQRSAVGD
ncbi:MAG: type II toxin-antitoxin system death-on-curing family toxin [Phycisphaeraceae bacterium]